MKIYQLRIDLLRLKPPIWRRVLVPDDITLDVLSDIIQTVMPWGGYHMHHFYRKDKHISMPTFYGPVNDDAMWGNDNEDESSVHLYEMLTAVKEKLYYEYDFGDSWEHSILLEKMLEPTPEQALPYCTTGRYACPPEDCGGAWGYCNYLEALEDPAHEEYEDAVAMLGEDFDPKHFDKDAINTRLAERFKQFMQ